MEFAPDLPSRRKAVKENGVRVRFVPGIPRVEESIFDRVGAMPIAKARFVAVEPVDVFTCLIAAARRRLVVDQGGERRPNDAEAFVGGPQAEIDVVVRDWEHVFVERAGRAQTVL